MNSADTSATRSSRSGLRATPGQEAVLRRAAEQTLLDRRLFMVPGSQYQAPRDPLEQPEHDNAGLADVAANCPPWGQHLSLAVPAPVAADHLINDFGGGKAGLDDVLIRHARQGQARGFARTFAVAEGRRVVACFGLAAVQVDRVEAPKYSRKGRGP